LVESAEDVRHQGLALTEVASVADWWGLDGVEEFLLAQEGDSKKIKKKIEIMVQNVVKATEYFHTCKQFLI